MMNQANSSAADRKLRILACKPRLAKQTIRQNLLIRCEPLELEYLYTVLRHHDIQLLDGINDHRDPVHVAKKLKSQVVLFTSLITNISDVIETAARLKKLPDHPLIFVGGPHAEVVPDHFFSENIDGVFFANQLEALSLVIRKITDGLPYFDVPGGAFRINGKFIVNPSHPLDPAKLPHAEHVLLKQFPDRYRIIYYKPCATLKTAFGCTGKCTFCFCAEMNGRMYGERPLKDVILEIEEIQAPHILILDDNFFSGRKRMAEFCERIEQRGIQKEFIVIGNARFIVQNPDIMARLRRAGVKAVMVGFEFVTDEELAAVHKNATLAENNLTIKICRDLDIDLFALFMVNPDWHHAGFRRLSRYIKENRIPFALFSTMTIFPGTQMARDHPESISHETKWWRYDMLRLHRKPAHMPAFVFYGWLFYLYLVPGMQFASIKKYWQRFGIFGMVRHTIVSFLMGLEYLIKLLIWK